MPPRFRECGSGEINEPINRKKINEFTNPELHSPQYFPISKSLSILENDSEKLYIHFRINNYCCLIISGFIY